MYPSMMRRYTTFLLGFIFLPILFSVSSAGDTLSQAKNLTDGDTLVSSGNQFVLGFFSPGSSKSRYLGIWYHFSNQTVVWIANREFPIPDSTAVLKIAGNGSLTLLYDANKIVWTSDTLKDSTVIAQLLDSGNLVIRSPGRNDYLWQSFDHPTDTLLPGMKLGFNLKSGVNLFLTSWSNSSDPSPGNHACFMDQRRTHEIYIKGNVTEYRLGPWNGLRFSGVPRMSSYNMFKFNFVVNQDGAYYSFEDIINTVISRLILDPSGILARVVWSDQIKTWSTFWTAPKDDCDSYAKCGPNGVCDNESLEICQCYNGFKAKSSELWSLRDYKLGCVRNEKLDCSQQEGFLLVKGVKLPDTFNSTINVTINLKDCEDACRKNCSCTAYAASDISENTATGCIMWFEDLIDTRKFTIDGQDLYLRLPASELDQSTPTHKTKGATAALSVVISSLVLAAIGYFIWKMRKKMNRMQESESSLRNSFTEYNSTRLGDDLPLFDFATIASATDNFSIKIGEGGFGPVYKGILPHGGRIAVKRLSKVSGQGPDEFMNEVMLIAKLQHRNLVRLLGCCIERGEQMLVYEYMQNGSLNTFIFDKNKRALLDWRKRVHIMRGIARGILYLHQDSAFRVIHRDLKAANILLDDAMNPKISDFGTARIFGDHQLEENTKRVVGTYGYMSPEYAMEGLFSEKSDVFSFGVLSLEIISGRMNKLYREHHNQNLLQLAWGLWKEGKGLELLDEELLGMCPISEVLKCIQICLLCVQECAADRPPMSTVVLMLNSDSLLLSEPNKPGFYGGRRDALVPGNDGSSNSNSSFTVNEVTITTLEYR